MNAVQMTLSNRIMKNSKARISIYELVQQSLKSDYIERYEIPHELGICCNDCKYVHFNFYGQIDES